MSWVDQCRTCEHLAITRAGKKQLWKCRSFFVMGGLSGRIRPYCADARDVNGKCGPNAIFYTEKK